MPNVKLLLQWNANQFYNLLCVYLFTLEIKGLLFLASKVYYGFSFFNIFPIQSVFLYVC